MTEAKKTLVDQFFDKLNSDKLYALGRNQEAIALDQIVGMAGFIDDYVANGVRFRGKPVIRIEDVPDDAFVVNCSTSISPVSAFRRLDNERRFFCLNYCDLLNNSYKTLPLPNFVADTRADYEQNSDRYRWVEGLLKDHKSRKSFKDLLAFRMSGDPRSMVNYKNRTREQYFEDFLELQDCVFVDAGGYNGDTTEKLCQLCNNNYKKILFFEPSPQNMIEAKRRLQKKRDILFFETALSDREEVLRFDISSGSASAVSKTSGYTVNATTLDKAVDIPVSIIKMDLEGWELKALDGAREHIAQDKPALAIAVYHCASDIWRIPEYVLSLNENYDLYLRHYTEGWSETVLFFIPSRP